MESGDRVILEDSLGTSKHKLEAWRVNDTSLAFSLVLCVRQPRCCRRKPEECLFVHEFINPEPGVQSSLNMPLVAI